MSVTTGTITAIGNTVQMSPPGGNVVVSVSGTYAGVEFVFEASEDGVNFYSIGAHALANNLPSETSELLTNAIKAWNIQFLITYSTFRIRAIGYTSGTANIRITADQTPIPISITSGSGSDGTGRLRTSILYRIFAYEFTQGDNAVYWDTTNATGGTATFLANQNAMSLNTTTTNGSSCIRQTGQRFFHQVGLTHTFYMGLKINTGQTNNRRRWGAFDNQDGVFFSLDGTTLNANIRTFATGAAVDTTVAQASWNIDKLNGTGASGFTLDLTKINTFFVEFIWFGSGRARLGVQFGGQNIYCHEFQGENILTNAFISRSTLPVRLEITNTAGTGATSSMQHYSVGVFSDSGQEPLGVIRTVDLAATGKAISNAVYTPLISIRLIAANNRAVLRPIRVSLSHTSGAVVNWRAIFNGVLTAPTWVAVTGTNVISERDTAATGIVGGDIVFGGNLCTSSGAYATYDLTTPSFMCSDGTTSDILSIVAQRNGAVTTEFASLTYMELI